MKVGFSYAPLLPTVSGQVWGGCLREPSSRRLVSGGCNLVTDCLRVIRLDASKLPVANVGYWPVVRVRGRAKKLTFDPAAGVSPG